MKDLSRHIEYLLCEYDSVAIPGIGTFSTEELPARYYMEERIYLPPVKSVLLDIDKKSDDGKLENCLIQLHSITRNVAKKWIADYINEINQALAEVGFMDIGTMGRLVYANNTITFEVCEAGINSPEWYGLDSFVMPMLPTYAHKSHSYKDPTHFTIRLSRKTVHRVMTAAAMIIVALTVIVPNYSSFNLNSKWQTQFASVESLITFFSTNPKPIVEQTLLATAPHPADYATEDIIQDNIDSVSNSQDSTIHSTYIEEQTEQIQKNNVEVPAVQELAVQKEIVQEELMEEEAVEEAVQETLAESPLEVKGYCVVMASAITHKGAEHLISKLNKEGFTNAVKYNDKGMLRVVLTGYNNEEAARADMAIVRAVDALYSGSWLKHF